MLGNWILMIAQRSTTVVLADDHEFLRDGLKLMFKKNERHQTGL